MTFVKLQKHFKLEELEKLVTSNNSVLKVCIHLVSCV